MSLLKLFQTISGTKFGKLVDVKLQLLKEVNPDKIYVENIRALYKIPSKAAKFLCEMAVRENLFIRQISAYCPDSACSTKIGTWNSKDEIPEKVECENCLHLEHKKHTYKRDELELIITYALNKDLFPAQEPNPSI